MLTVAILTHNSERQLEELLPTLSWADKLVIIDDGSTDKTVKIAESFGAKVYRRRLSNYAKQRNYALGVIRTKWTLFIDPDERVTEKTAAEILRRIKKPGKAEGWALLRKEVFLGKKMKFGQAKDQYMVRLGKTKAGRWRREVHETWDIGPVEKIDEPFWHDNRRSYGEFLSKVKQYAQSDAQYRNRQKEAFSLFELLCYPQGKFVHLYFIKLGILDGWRGFLLSLGMAIHSAGVRWYGLKLRWIKLSTRNGLEGWFLGLWLLIAGMVPLGHLTRMRLSETVVVYGFEILMLPALIAAVGVMARSKERRLDPGLLGWHGLLLGGMGLSLAVNFDLPGEIWMAGSMYLVRLGLYVAFGLASVAMLAKGYVPVLRILAYVGVAMAMGGLAQYLLIPDMRFMYELGWDDHYYRLVGTIFDPGFMGLLLILGLVATFGESGKRWWYARGLVFTAIMLTFARSAYVVLAIVMGWYWVSKRKYAAIGLFAALMIVSLWLLPKPGGEGVNLMRAYSIEGRARSVVTAWELFKENRVFGIGFNTYKWITAGEKASLRPSHPSAPDNSLMLVLATSGLVGATVYIGYVAWLMLRYCRQETIGLSMGAIMLHSLTNNSFFYVFVLWWWMVLVIAGEQGRSKVA